MAQHNDVPMTLYRARLRLEEGQYEAALSTLEALAPQDEMQQREVAYLLGWCYIQLKRWNDAIQALSPLLVKYMQDVHEPETQLERERLAHYLLRLGIAAVNISQFEDASQHFTLCLKVLHDRRVHLPAVRIKARYSLAMTCIMRGLYTAAVQHYEEALRLSRHYNQVDALADVYYGLSEAYRHTGEYERAYMAAQEALSIYQGRTDRPMEARMHYQLGRIRFLMGAFSEASDHYTESLAIATSHNTSRLIMANCASLADVRLSQGRLDDAKRFCKLALDTAERIDDPYMKGMTYQVAGKVARQEARQTEGTQQCMLLGEAERWFARARDQLVSTQAYGDIAEIYEYWGEALEALGRTQEAIQCWRSGYEILSHVKGTR